MRVSMKILLIAAFSILTSAAFAEGDKDLGRFNSWQAHSYSESGNNVCNLWSRPQTHEEGGKQRGDIFFYVTHRPGAKRFHEVSIDMGYPLKPESNVVLKIGANTFNLFVKGQSAFARSEDDPKIVKALRAGNSMIVTGKSTNDTQTKDSYNLSGFSKANDALNKACGTAKP